MSYMREAFERSISKSTEIDPGFLATLHEVLAKHKESEFSILEAREHERDSVHATEEKIDSLSANGLFIPALLERYGIRAHVKETDAGYLEIPVSDLPKGIPRLPAGYGYKGGAARAILQYSLGMENEPPRDLDILFCGTDEDENLTNELAKRYMPDDLAGGYGVEKLKADYFDSRDFTINEVYFDGQRIVCTRQCLTDLLRNIVRFASYEKQESYKGDEFFVSPKLMAKAIRLVAESQIRGKKNARLADETLRLKNIYINDFNAALHLEKAMQVGRRVAERYVDIMIEFQFLPDNIRTAPEAFEYLTGRTDFIFRCSPEKEIATENPFLNKMEEVFSHKTHTLVVPFWKKV